MHNVDHYELIRRKFYVDGMSQREIARELNHSRKFVKKALENPAPTGYCLRVEKPKPTLGPVRAIIDAWLENDLTQPVKQRHSAQRIYERLVAEHQFTGNNSTVRRYVATWKQARAHGGKEVFVPLLFQAGEEAQVDWGEAWIIENGQRRKVQLFCMKWCYSRHVFVRAYDHANLESFLDGHVQAFEYFGGVPKRLAYDNLKSAVIKVGKGRSRRLNTTFMELRSWYLFDSRFCNVARGNEKGHVENLVKRAQRTFLTPLPEVISVTSLNTMLLSRCSDDLRQKAKSGETHEQLWDLEKRHVLALPRDPFHACRRVETRADKYSLVAFDHHLYSVPVAHAHHNCSVRGYVDRIEVYHGSDCIASHMRATDGQQRYVLNPHHYVAILARKPGLIHHGRPFQNEAFGPDFELLRRELEYRYQQDGTLQYIEVLLLLSVHPPEQVIAAVQRCVARRAFSRDAVVHELHGKPQATTYRRLDLGHRPNLAHVEPEVRDTSIYDQLRTNVEVQQ